MFRRQLCLVGLVCLALVLSIFGFSAVATAQVQLKFNVGEDFPGDGGDNPANYNLLNWRRNLGTIDEAFEGVDGQSAADAIDFNNGLASGISLLVTSATGFNEIGPNRDGSLFPSAPATNFFDVEAFEDNLFGHDSNFNVGEPRAVVEYTLSGLNSSKFYDFTMFASRFGAGENREAQYDVAGTNSGVGFLDPDDNASAIAQVLQIQPTAAGQLTFTIQKGPNNVSTQGFYYLGAFEVLENGNAPPLGLAGDYNGDTIVNAADYTVWLDNLGSTTALAADGDGNLTVDAADYGVWKTNFGNSIGTATGSSIPEPMSASLAVVFGLIAFSFRGRVR